MKQFAAIILILACHAATACAQTFTQRLQTKIKNQGTVTVHHDKAIDELVNGSWHKANSPHRGSTTTNNTVQTKTTAKAEQNDTPKEKTTVTNKTETKPAHTTVEPDSNAEPDIADTRKKVMVGAYKVNGYRVQAFAGGNSRRDRQEAERIGNEIKALFPSQPVYVHFYSPRWICRIGNFRTYEEAHQMLNDLRKLGYKQALIVKGKITVQY